MSPVQVGQWVYFDPNKGIRIYGFPELHRIVVGKVVYINEEHRWFSVEYGKDTSQRISFNFNDFGMNVRLCD